MMNTDPPQALAFTATGQHGPPVVLLHGLFGAAQNFGAVAKALGSRFRVVALDLRNHGQSPHAASMTYPDMAADVAATLAALGLPRAAVVGHSMGGKVAMALAQAHPERVDRLCVVDIAPRAYRPSLAAYAAALAAIPLKPGLRRAEADAALAASVASPAERAFLLLNLRFETDPPSWRLNLPGIQAGFPEISAWVPPATPTYPGPTLFLAGERSDYIRPEDWPAIQARFPAARLEAVPGAGHWVHAEAPSAFLERLVPFLEAA
jgi:pimeloyl-ACP methyl ester carboxylesterase